MNKATRKFLHIIIGTIAIIFGIVGLVLPILNGTVLLIIGLIILSFESPTLRAKLLTFSKKNDTIHHLYIKLEKILRKFFF
jgi:uncharacterized membrane protein YbaN (DUF454 family)